MAAQAYPRPDFERAHVHWKSLNGPWDFLFDDDDAGLSERWQLQGLPAQVTSTGAGSSRAAHESESERITQKIAAGTQNLIKDNLAFRGSAGTVHQRRQIQVPFVFQSPASGINERGDHEVLWYERLIEDIRTAEEKNRGDRALLRFGAVDYEAKIWLNGQFVGGHRGGHVPFEVDITDSLDSAPSGPLRLTLRVYDSAYDLTQPRGKQYWGAKPESIFYTPSGGIWQSVWIETVPAARIADSSFGTVLRANDIESGDLHAQIAVLGRKAGHRYSVELEASFAGTSVATSPKKELPKEKNHVVLDLGLRLSQQQLSSLPAALQQEAPLESERCWRNGLALWSPEHPLLYDLTLRLFDSSGALVDEVKTSTGMRSLDWTKGDGALHLNGRPLFQALTLDQGYWPDTFMTPPSPDSLKADIELCKKMGFNGCRKHQKVEDPVFLYWADRLGYLVWGEMANAYQFSQEYVDRFNQEWIEAVKRDINHPSIITWTPVNESWAYTSLKDNVEQRNHIRALYYMTKTLDPTRPINDNCGWEHVCTDLTTFHDYSDAPALTETCSTLQGILAAKAGRPMFVAPIPGLDPGAEHRPGAVTLNTEFGGVNIAPASGDSADEWGYTTATDPDDLLQRIERLMMGIVEAGHSSGFVYTQLADIEQETNGLYSFDRKEKLSAERVKAVLDKVLRVFYSSRGL
ncbi:Beta-galactosidase [Lasiodiplodia theobromae]|uniref:Beta-galactosidase n=1 Tax=Lasiodiplodia theobromae TaxID=45133 RepID=A0A5N5DEV6_9PEZI|nr:Beta-galactosidase [Lasiodiplodia theobromae]